MLRECHRVLHPGGRLAAVVIELAPRLDQAARDRALRLAPANVTTEGPLEELVARAGLERLRVEDWSAELASTAGAVIEGMRRREAALRAAEGDEVFEHELSKKLRIREGLALGLLRRTLVVAERRPVDDPGRVARDRTVPHRQPADGGQGGEPGRKGSKAGRPDGS